MLDFPDRIPVDAIEVLSPMLRGKVPPKKIGIKAAWNLAGFAASAIPDDVPPSPAPAVMLRRGKVIPAKIADALDSLDARCKKAGGRTATGRFKGGLGEFFADVPWLVIARFLYAWAGDMLDKAEA